MSHLNIFVSLLILLIGSFSISYTINLLKRYHVPFLKNFNHFIIIFNIYFLLQTILEYILSNVKLKADPKIFLKITVFTDFFFSIILLYITWRILLLFSHISDKLFKRSARVIFLSLSGVLILTHLGYIILFMNNFTMHTFHLIMLIYVLAFTLSKIIYLFMILFMNKNNFNKSQITLLKHFAVIFILVELFVILCLGLKHFQIMEFNIAFFAAFLIYNLLPVIFMKRFIKTIFPELIFPGPLNNSRQELYSKYRISKREQEIISLILEGNSNKEIEDKLFISIATVKDHVYKIYKKTGVKNRVQLVNLFYRLS